MPRKILIVTDNLKDQINGVVTTFKNIEEKARLDNFDFIYLDPGEFPHIACPGYPEIKISWPKEIGKKIRKISPDHIHIATEGPLGLAVRIWCEKNNIKYNTSYHTKFPEFLKELYGIPLSVSYAYLRWFHKNSSKVLTTTNTMVKELRERGFRDNVIPWTRGVNREDLSSHGPRKINPIPVVLSVGRISKEKNLEALIPLQDGYRLIVVGDGPYMDIIAKKLPKAFFVGYKKGTELANLYRDADVFVFTSKTDTFGLVMIEAMSQGTPVAAFPVPGPIDVIDNGLTGVMDYDLRRAVSKCLELNRDTVKGVSSKWSWDNAWTIFKENLVGGTGFEPMTTCV